MFEIMETHLAFYLCFGRCFG